MTRFRLWSHGNLQVKYGNAFVLIMLLFILLLLSFDLSLVLIGSITSFVFFLLRAHGIVACFPYINRQTVAVSNRLLISDPFFLAYFHLSTGCEFGKCVSHGMAITFIEFRFQLMLLCSLKTAISS